MTKIVYGTEPRQLSSKMGEITISRDTEVKVGYIARCSFNIPGPPYAETSRMGVSYHAIPFEVRVNEPIFEVAERALKAKFKVWIGELSKTVRG
jgi:hypothetical protein